MVGFNVLEVGCASGYPVGNDLLNDGFNYSGIDISEEQIELAIQNYPTHKEKFIQSDVFDYLGNLENNSIDGVISFFTIFHIPRSYHTV